MVEAWESTSARVLIVDAEEDQRSGLASLVSSWGFSVETAFDGQDALEKLQMFPAQVVLTQQFSFWKSVYGTMGDRATENG